MPLREIDPNKALRHYDIPPARSIEPAGGTAGRTWKVVTDRGDYFLRLRGVRTSSEQRLVFDHGLRDHLVVNDIPTAATLPAKSGDRWLRLDDGVYELYPFVVGRLFDPNQIDEVAAAGRALARYHTVAAAYSQPDGEPIAQYTTLGFYDRTSDRMDDPGLQRLNAERARELASTAEDRSLADWVLARLDRMARDYAGAAFDRLTGWVIHGDYTPANLLFSNAGNVVGIFDLDWALPGARCRDVADGLYFFATKPRQIDGTSIWSLTDAATFDEERCTAFLRAYQNTSPLAPHEVDSIPFAFAGRWISIRLEGMAKVDPDERFRFFSRDVRAPLEWLDEHWESLRTRVW